MRNTDTVKAKLTPREAVLNRNAAELLGRHNIARLNAHGNMLSKRGVDLAGLQSDPGPYPAGQNLEGYQRGTSDVEESSKAYRKLYGPTLSPPFVNEIPGFGVRQFTGDERLQNFPVRPYYVTPGVGVQSQPATSYGAPYERQYQMGTMDVGDDRTDLLRDADNTFYGGGQAPAPTPTPTPMRGYQYGTDDVRRRRPTMDIFSGYASAAASAPTTGVHTATSPEGEPWAINLPVSPEDISAASQYTGAAGGYGMKRATASSAYFSPENQDILAGQQAGRISRIQPETLRDQGIDPSQSMANVNVNTLADIQENKDRQSGQLGYQYGTDDVRRRRTTDRYYRGINISRGPSRDAITNTRQGQVIRSTGLGPSYYSPYGGQGLSPDQNQAYQKALRNNPTTASRYAQPSGPMSTVGTYQGAEGKRAVISTGPGSFRTYDPQGGYIGRTGNAADFLNRQVNADTSNAAPPPAPVAPIQSTVATTPTSLTINTPGFQPSGLEANPFTQREELTLQPRRYSDYY